MTSDQFFIIVGLLSMIKADTVGGALVKWLWAIMGIASMATPLVKALTS